MSVKRRARRIPNSHPRGRWEDTAWTTHLTRSSGGLLGLGSISRYRKQCQREGDIKKWSEAVMQCRKPCWGETLLLATSCWRGAEWREYCGAELIQETITWFPQPSQVGLRVHHTRHQRHPFKPPGWHFTCLLRILCYYKSSRGTTLHYWLPW